MARLVLPSPFKSYVQGKQEVEVTGKTVSEVLWSFAERYPEIRTHLFDGHSEELRPFVNIFINGEDVRNLHGGQTPVQEGDQLRIVPSIAGGSVTSSSLKDIV